jgi:CHAT domain-containing protein/tetratricopeptide (TPR) repeat protein
MRKKIKLSIKLSFCLIFLLSYFSQTVFVQGQTQESKDWYEIATLYEKAVNTADFKPISSKMATYRSKHLTDLNSISYLRITFLIGYLMDQGDLNKDAKRYYSECLRHPMIESQEAFYARENIKVFAAKRIKVIDDSLTQRKPKQISKKITVSGGSKGNEKERLPRPAEISINQREMIDAEKHQYQIDLMKDEFLQIIAEQKGIDILLKLSDSKGSILATMDSPNGKQGFETLSFIAQIPATYTLEVGGLDAKAEKGFYSFQTEQRFPATNSDKKRVEVEKLFVEGMTAKDIKEQEEVVVKKLEEALKGWRELKDEYLIKLTLKLINQLKNAKADNLLDEGTSLFKEGTDESYRGALLKYNEATRLYQEIDNKTENAGISLLASGLISDNLGDKSVALKFYDQALLIFRFIKNVSLESTTLNNKGRVYDSLGEKQKALYFLNQALQLRIKIDDVVGQAATLTNIGSVYTDLGEKQKALEFFNQALPLRIKVGDFSGQATTLASIGSVYDDLGDKQRALEMYNQATPLFIKVNDIRGLANIYSNIGLVYDSLGNKQEAAAYYDQALPLFIKIGDVRGQANTINNIGVIFSSLGEKQKALVFFNQALRLLIKVGDARGQAKMLNNIGMLYDSLGEKEKALEFLKQQALPLRIKVGDVGGQATTLNNIGSVYYSLGEKQRALEFFNQALTLRIKVGDVGGQAGTLNNIALVYDSIGEKQKALEFYNQALPLMIKVGDISGQAKTLNNIGTVCLSIGKTQEALDFYNQALSLKVNVRDVGGQAATLINIGLVYDSLNEKNKAIRFYNQALPLMIKVGDVGGQAKTLDKLMYQWESLKNNQLAIFYGKQAANKYQELRANIKGLNKDIQRTFIKSVSNSYSLLAQILLDQNRVDEALQVLSLFKEDEFFESYRLPALRQNAVNLALTQHEKEAQVRYQILSDKLSMLGSNITELENKKFRSEEENLTLTKLNLQLNTETGNLQKLLDGFVVEFSKTADKDKPPQVPEIQVLQDNLKELNKLPKTKTAAIYTLIGDEKFYVLLVTGDKPVISKSCVIERKDFLKKVDDFRGVLQNPEYDPQDLASELYQIILKPIEKELDKAKINTLMWSLDGQLRYLPPAALFDASRNEYLVQRYRNVLFTPAGKSDLNVGKTTSQIWKGLGLGVSEKQTVELYGNRLSFPALTNVLPEIRGIIKQPAETNGIYGGKRLENSQFSSETFKAELQNKYQLVHVSSHFYFNYRSPIESFLLTGTGKLSLSAVLENQKFFDGVELLSLSACETAIGNTDANGKEIEGFAVLAQQRGAKAIMATLWSVADESTAKIMQDFYRTYNTSTEMSKAEAIRLAQLKYLKEADKIGVITKRNSEKIDLSGKKTFTKEKTKHPYFWAPFILYGDWK